MLITPTVLQQLETAFRILYTNSFDKTETNYQKIAMTVPSTTKSNTYGFLGKVPKLREWIGERHIHNLASYGFSITNKKFELTIGVPRDDIEDDNLGIYRTNAEIMGVSVKQHPDEIIFDLLMDGFAQKCYDDQAFFGTHTIGKTSYTNHTNKKLTADELWAGYTFLANLKDEYGKPMKIRPNLLVVAEKNKRLAKKILENQLVADGGAAVDNETRGLVDLLVVPELSAHGDYWFLLDTTKPVKPLIFQDRRKPQFTFLNKPTDHNVFMQDKYIFGVDRRDNAGFGLWQLAYGSIGTVA